MSLCEINFRKNRSNSQNSRKFLSQKFSPIKVSSANCDEWTLLFGYGGVSVIRTLSDKTMSDKSDEIFH